MKAVTYTEYGPADTLRISETNKPTPAENELLIRVSSSTVTPVDCYARQGAPFMVRLDAGLFRPKEPVLGSEFAGVVEGVGRAVTRFHPGERIFGAVGHGPGAHAEYICLPEDGALARQPDNLGPTAAAALPYGTLTALPFLRDTADIKRGQRLLINGASGSVGSYAVQLGQLFGARVTAVCSGANRAWVAALGADEVIDYTQTDFTASSDQYDVIFDAIGASSFAACRRALTSDGIYMTTVPSLTILGQMLWTKARGGKLAKFAAAGLRSTAERRQDLHFIKGLVESGVLQPVIDRSFLLADIAAAHRYVDTGRKRGNVILLVDEQEPAPAPSDFVSNPSQENIHSQ